MILKNAEIFNSNFDIVKNDIKITNGKIEKIGTNIKDDEYINLEGYIILPGFVDIHTHACIGHDMTDGNSNSVMKISEWLATKGVTSFCPTSMTLSIEDLKKSFRYTADVQGKESGAYIHGINMEGPFISPEKKGAQSKEYIISPDFDIFCKLNSICKISIVDIAPEMPNADEFIKKATEVCTVSAAHTQADYDTAVKAFDLGINHITHLFNAMPPLLSRAPGLVGAAMDDERIFCEIICDGIHIAPSVLRTTFRVLGEDRSIVISDSMAAAGMCDGEYSLGGQKVFVENGKATLADGTVAGSTTNIFDEFKNLLKFGIPLKQAVKSCTINPAKSIKADNITGSITEGKNADLIVLDKEMQQIKAVYIKGKKII